MLSRDEYLRDMNIKGQMEDFIYKFQKIDSNSIDNYRRESRMSEIDFINYLSFAKANLQTKKDNEIYGHLVDEYISIINNIIDYN